MEKAKVRKSLCKKNRKIREEKYRRTERGRRGKEGRECAGKREEKKERV